MLKQADDATSVVVEVCRSRNLGGDVLQLAQEVLRPDVVGDEAAASAGRQERQVEEAGRGFVACRKDGQMKRKRFTEDQIIAVLREQ